MKRLKSMSLVLTSLLTASIMLSACGNNEKPNNAQSTASTSPKDAAIDTSKAVDLKMIMLGPKPADYDLVFGEINKILKQKVNATLQTEFLDWSDYKQKYPLKFAANEDFDLVFTANWSSYADQANKGGFLELKDDMLAKYAPITWKTIDKVKWDQAKVKGKLYMIPYNIPNEYKEKTIIYREDLREKYSLPPITDGASFAKYSDTIAKNEKGVTPFGATLGTVHTLDTLLLLQKNNWKQIDGTPFAFNANDATGKVFNIYDTPEFKELLTYYKTLAENGSWMRDVLTYKGSQTEDFKAGKIASYSHTLSAAASAVNAVKSLHPDWKVGIADIAPDSKKSNPISTQNGMSIHATSKFPERSLMVLDLLQNDKQLHDLVMYGIEGTHYSAVGNDQYMKLDKFASFNTFTNWGFQSTLNRTETTYPQAAKDIEAKWKPQVMHYKLETFVFDTSKVVNEVSNVSNVMTRYGLPLEYGLVKETDKGLTELTSQLKAANAEKIQTEIQNQINTFLAENK
ncbi:extracellular solute-binding protein [Paenibacillus qinlingensis]|uniref:Aldouronate transport system substrate-binding protein n=1 Tax=Paenibacillus qinlingensis TaxID=1837343 RepID=A0ABU1P0C7_9BACL|nr:extracellular solute-binding protein [Paenibacillus qinlingensis]MDR6553175.1 putative aldouronate transport system substrate-binding protein [Paenibacillus qinlingensis]